MADDTVTAAPAPTKPSRIIDRIGVTDIIDITLISGLFLIIVMWVFFTPTENQILIALATAWATMTATVVNFHRGSSAGSKNKDDATNRMMDKMTPPTGTGPDGAAPAVIAAATVAAVEAAKAAAPAAAEAAAPAAAEKAAPPAAEEAAPPAVKAELDERGYPKQKE